MVGFTYDLGHSTLLDVNYRFLHIGGSDISLGYEGLRSSVSFDAQNEHQLRAGLRFNID
jgi:opacity protein-like surface antigen